jgi:hypothetical protein
MKGTVDEKKPLFQTPRAQTSGRKLSFRKVGEVVERVSVGIVLVGGLLLLLLGAPTVPQGSAGFPRPPGSGSASARGGANDQTPGSEAPCAAGVVWRVAAAGVPLTVCDFPPVPCLLPGPACCHWLARQ